MKSSFLVGVGFLALVITAGVFGYVLIEGWSVFDALYMTVITITTVGYGEIHPLSKAGRIFTVFLIVGGVAGALYTLTFFIRYILEGQLGTIWWRRHMKNKIEQLKGHIIVCGYGRVGREVARRFHREEMSFVVVDKDEGAIAQAEKDGFLFVRGDATLSDVLKEAGIESAQGIVVAGGDDADNLYITLLAKELYPQLTVVARCNTPEAEPRLRRVGANRVIQPHVISGQRIAMLALRPSAVDFVDTLMVSRGGEVLLEDIEIVEGSPFVGRKVEGGQWQVDGVVLLAVKKRDGSFISQPSLSTTLEAGDELVVLGTREQMKSLERNMKV